MRFFTPAQAAALAGTSPDRFRDWRRRGLLDDFGVYPLPNGGWTRDAQDERLQGNGRWEYVIGDVLGIAIVTELSKLGVELKAAFSASDQLRGVIYSYLREGLSNKETLLYPYVVIYLAGTGRDMCPGLDVQAVLISDLNNTFNYADVACTVVSISRLAASLSEDLRSVIAGAV